MIFLKQFIIFKKDVQFPFYDIEINYGKESLLIKYLNSRFVMIFSQKGKKINLIEEYEKLNVLYKLI